MARPVPPELVAYLQKNQETLWPDLRKLWEAAGAKTAGTWPEVFGTGTAADEIFMAWNYARYLGHMTEAGKAEYPIPVFANTWIVQPEDKGPGDWVRASAHHRHLEGRRARDRPELSRHLPAEL